MEWNFTGSLSLSYIPLDISHGCIPASPTYYPWPGSADYPFWTLNFPLWLFLPPCHFVFRSLHPHILPTSINQSVNWNVSLREIPPVPVYISDLSFCRRFSRMCKFPTRLSFSSSTAVCVLGVAWRHRTPPTFSPVKLLPPDHPFPSL